MNSETEWSTQVLFSCWVDNIYPKMLICYIIWRDKKEMTAGRL